MLECEVVDLALWLLVPTLGALDLRGCAAWPLKLELDPSVDWSVDFPVFCFSVEGGNSFSNASIRSNTLAPPRLDRFSFVGGGTDADPWACVPAECEDID